MGARATYRTPSTDLEILRYRRGVQGGVFLFHRENVWVFTFHTEKNVSQETLIKLLTCRRLLYTQLCHLTTTSRVNCFLISQWHWNEIPQQINFTNLHLIKSIYSLYYLFKMSYRACKSRARKRGWGQLGGRRSIYSMLTYRTLFCFGPNNRTVPK